MASAASRVTVGTTATPIVTSARGSVVIRHRGSNPVYLGGSDVTTGNGFQLDAGDTLYLDLHGGEGETLYGRVATGTETLHVLGYGIA